MGKYIISLSFKEEEKALYDEIKSHSCPSGYIKDLLLDKIKIKQTQTEQKEVTSYLTDIF